MKLYKEYYSKDAKKNLISFFNSENIIIIKGGSIGGEKCGNVC